MKRLFLLPILLLFTFFNAQEYIMQDGTVTTCSGTFYDSGGPTPGAYSSNENFVYTICPDRSTEPELATVLDFYYLRTSLNNDVLYIYDGDDVTAPLIATLSGGTGSIVRASDIGTNSSGCLTVQFISDGGGEGQGWEATISCEIPCQKIESTVATLPAMNTDGNVEILETETVEFSSTTTFSQDGTNATYVWDFGDGNTASGENATHTYPNAGTYTVTLTVTDPDGCSGVYTFLVIVSYNTNVPCPAVSPRDVYTETEGDVVVNCSYPLEDGCIRLEANFVEIKGTESYVVQSIPFQPPFPLQSNDAFTIEEDDVWSGLTQFPQAQNDVPAYRFCFFGQEQSSLVVGANGRISFNPGEANTTDEWAFDSTLPLGANTNDPDMFNTISGAYHDINILGLPEAQRPGRFNFGFFGDYPCRAFVVNYDQIPLYSCSSEFTTQQIVLWEASNYIDVYLHNKPACSGWNNGNSLVGVQGPSVGQSAFAPGRNTGDWSAQQEAWRFIPDGAPLSVDIVWYDEDENEIGQGDEINVCPTEDTTYTVVVTYEICGQEDLTVSDTINITFDLEAPEVGDFPITLCDTDGDGVVTWDIMTSAQQTISAINSDWVIQGVYTELRGAGEADPVYLIADPTAYDSGERTVYVRVEAPNGCYSIVEVTLDISDGLEIGPLSETLCIEPGNTEITIDLSEYSQQISSDQIIDVYYYINQVDAETGEANYLQGTDLTEFTISSSTIVYIRVVSEDGCYGLSQLDIEVNEAPFRYIFDDPVQFCDTDPTGEENVDLTGYEDDIANGETGVTFLYFENYQDALDNDASAAITDPTQYTLTASVTELYILVQDANGCHKIITMPVVLSDGFALTPQPYPLCDEGNDGSEQWDLTSLNDQIIADSSNYTITYYQTQEDLNNGVEISDPTTFVSGETTIYVLVSNADGCSSDTTITLELNDVPVASSAPLSECPDENGALIFDLTEAESDLLNGQTGITLTYHNTQADAVQGENPITDPENYTGTDGEIVYVNMVLGDCSAVSQITLNASDVPTATQPDNIIVCDADASGNEEVDLTSREAAIIGTQTDLTITYHTSQEDANTGENAQPTPTTYLANVGTITIYVRIENDSECYVTTMFDVIVNSGPTLTPQSITLCDDGGDGSEVFDITSMNDQISGGVTGHTYAYYESVNDINTGNPITSDVTNYSSTGQIIYVVVNDGNDCPSYTELDLIVKPLPVVTDNTLPICDPDFDGEYGFTLTDLYGLVATNTSDYSFDVYTSLVDAQNMDNPMSQADAENITTVPFNVYVRVTEVSGEPLCSNIAMVELTQGDQTQVNTTFDTVYACDEGNGMATFDFSNLSVTTETADTEISFHTTMEDAENNNAPLTVDSALLGTGTIFVRVTAEGKCPSITQFDVEVIAKPIAEITSSNFSLCVDNTITLTASNYNSAYQYVWTNQDETVLGNGETVDIVGANGDQEITLTVTNAAASTSCQSTATQEIDVISTATIVDLDVSGTTVTVTATGQGPFEYSYDGINWQTSNVLTVPEDGYYDIYVRSYNLGCTGVGSSTLVLDINNVITPNGDGINDVFVIPFMDVFKDENNNVQPSTFNIYDRFGKLVHSDVSSEARVQFTWNGLFDGRIIPSGDYWYFLKLADGRELTGHITVKNR